MDLGARAVHRPRRAWPPAARIVAAIVATAGLALPAAAVGSSASSTVARGSSNARAAALAQSTIIEQALAYARCMRSHGVRNWPDPTGAGAFPKRTAQQLGVTSSQLQGAQRACQELLPNGGAPTPAALRRSWSDFLKFARCMRSHGVSNWPDPTAYPQHPDRPYFDLQRAGIDSNAPQVSTRIHECLPLLHGTNPQRLGEGGS
jgi:hypothetical protein